MWGSPPRRRRYASPFDRGRCGRTVVLTAATAAVYVWTKAPLYNPFGTIDPWLYTALWTNFDQIYESFPRTYYISRVPWIVPGYALNGIFDARTAALVLHTTFFLGGGVLFYVLCRRWLGVPAAAIGYVALIGSQMYFSAHRWDYQEGGVLTYMIGAYAFSLVRTQSPRTSAGEPGTRRLLRRRHGHDSHHRRRLSRRASAALRRRERRRAVGRPAEAIRS